MLGRGGRWVSEWLGWENWHSSADGVQGISTDLNKAVTVFHALSAGHAADIEILQQAEHLDQQDPNAISARIDQLLESREEA